MCSSPHWQVGWSWFRKKLSPADRAQRRSRWANFANNCLPRIGSKELPRFREKYRVLGRQKMGSNMRPRYIQFRDIHDRDISGVHCISMYPVCFIFVDYRKQGKSEGFESCDRLIVQKRPIWVKIGDVLYRVTLKFDGWPWETIGHLSFAVSSFVQHFIAIGEFKLELQSGNVQFWSNSTIFRAVWPWNLTYDLEKQ